MANLALSFRAQSLDNQSPDPVEVDNQRLTEEDVAQRQELAQKISKVSLDGTRVFSKGSHAASLHGNEFLLKTPSDQLDDAGRTAPLLCYGCVPDEPPASWSGDVVKAMVGFAERIGRTISATRQETAHRGVEKIIKKKRINKLRQKMLWWAALLILLSSVVSILWAIFVRK